MYFYILPGPYRLGFGITIDYVRRQKDYTGAWGGIAKFSHIYQGPGPHIKRLEDLLKVQHRHMLWRIDDWETEWLDNGWTPAQLSEFVDQIIVDRCLKVQLINEQTTELL